MKNQVDKTMKKVVILLILAMTFGCGDHRQSGPAEITWDRDACDNCRMMISDRHFAAQVRGGEKRAAFLFDDLGCALKWLDQQEWSTQPDVEVWVTDYQSGEWLDAKDALYVSGLTSPMDYGFGATTEAADGRLAFSQVSEQVRSRARSHSGHH